MDVMDSDMIAKIVSWKDKERKKKEEKIDLILKDQLEIQEEKIVSKAENIKQKSKLKKSTPVLNYLPSHGGRVRCHL